MCCNLNGFVGEDVSPAEIVGGHYDGEALSIVWYDAGFDIPSVNLLTEVALDAGVDAIVAISPIVAQITVNITSDMDEPPPVIFTIVEDPYILGIAQSACVKPAHVTGSIAPVPYEEILDIMRTHLPDLTTIGSVYASGDGYGEISARQIAIAAESEGLTFVSEGVNSASDFRAAANGLAARGVETFLAPNDSLSVQGLPILAGVAATHGIPLYHSDPTGILEGATVAAGFFRWYDQGLDVGTLVAARLAGMHGRTDRRGTG